MNRLHSENAWKSLFGTDPGLAASLMSRVRRGATLLDEYRNGWYRSIDRADIATDSKDRCVPAQLQGGDYRAAWDAILGPAPYAVQRKKAASYGFTLAESEEGPEPSDTNSEAMPTVIAARYLALDDLWVREVSLRLGEGGGP